MLRAENKKFIFIAGPCVVESEELTAEIAGGLKEITDKYPVEFIFKASFDKANRTSIDSYRGPGLREGMRILEKIKTGSGLKILSDVHTPDQVDMVRDILDVIQIPAFLCRQTDLLVAAARSNLPVNLKKAQFMSPEDMKYAADKISSSGNNNIMLTERGTCFGYNNLVVDFRSILIMKKFGYPVIFDATHSLQKPSAAGGISGGEREFVSPFSLAAVACGCDGIFLEVHPRPEEALSDKHTSFPLGKVEQLLERVLAVRLAAGN